MRVVAQRVREAAVTVDEEVVGRIGEGLLVFLGIGEGDDQRDVSYLAEKLVHLRIFRDHEDRMNRSVLDIQGSLLVISQFTLWGDCRKGRRPSFDGAARVETARPLYEAFLTACEAFGVPVEAGRFQAHMEIRAVNDGPVTMLLDSKKLF